MENKDTHSGVSFCRVVSDANYVCSSTTFSTNGTGIARGYQKGWSVAFTFLAHRLYMAMDYQSLNMVFQMSQHHFISYNYWYYYRNDKYQLVYRYRYLLMVN